jgi:SAM-dependent methyltransferase
MGLRCLVLRPGICVDLVHERKPHIVASAAALPFKDRSFDLYLSDPPYTDEDSRKYGTPPFPLRKFMSEAHRVLDCGGHLGVLHFYYPDYKRKEWALRGLIAVITGFRGSTRVFSIFEKIGKRGNHPTWSFPSSDPIQLKLPVSR